jgi:alkanesulfonate monooxygenase SsuD/methylene tetrahydromethanopterin reductase-like flavin-dependent oxidoreductase (luciferase family)
MRAVDRSVVSVGSSIFSPVMVGSPATIVDQFRWLATETRLAGVMLTFPDWYADLAAFGETVVPALKREGLMQGGVSA